MSIPIPAGMTRGQVTWRIGHDRAGSTLPGASGTVRFEPTARAVSYTSATVLPEPVETPVVAGVMTPVSLQVNDPAVWSWRVTPLVGVPWPPFPIDVVASGVDLAKVAVIEASVPTRLVTAEQLRDVVRSDDPRLTDARTPTSHKHAVADVDGLAERLAALERDTGWRNIIALSPDGILADDATSTSRLRRVGDIVYLEGYGFPGDVLKTVNLAAAHVFAELPLGFHAASYSPARGTLSHAYGNPFGTIEFFADRAQPRLNMGAAAVGKYTGFLSWSVEFHTTDPWPTDLPG